MRKIILPVVMLCALSIVSCGKERQCKCTTTDVPDDGLLKVLVLDGSLSCDDITLMGIERKTTSDDGTQTIVREEMHEVSCRDYASGK